MAQDLVDLPLFQEAVQLVARAAMIAPSIDARGLQILREATAFAEQPEPEGALTTCST